MSTTIALKLPVAFIVRTDVGRVLRVQEHYVYMRKNGTFWLRGERGAIDIPGPAPFAITPDTFPKS